MRRLTLAIEGMMCDGCAGTVREALVQVEGVENVEVALEERRARITVVESTPDVVARIT